MATRTLFTMGNKTTDPWGAMYVVGNRAYFPKFRLTSNGSEASPLFVIRPGTNKIQMFGVCYDPSTAGTYEFRIYKVDIDVDNSISSTPIATSNSFTSSTVGRPSELLFAEFDCDTEAFTIQPTNIQNTYSSFEPELRPGYFANGRLILVHLSQADKIMGTDYHRVGFSYSDNYGSTWTTNAGLLTDPALEQSVQMGAGNIVPSRDQFFQIADHGSNTYVFAINPNLSTLQSGGYLGDSFADYVIADPWDGTAVSMIWNGYALRWFIDGNNTFVSSYNPASGSGVGVRWKWTPQWNDARPFMFTSHVDSQDDCHIAQASDTPDTWTFTEFYAATDYGTYDVSNIYTKNGRLEVLHIHGVSSGVYGLTAIDVTPAFAGLSDLRLPPTPGHAGPYEV